MTTTRRPRRLRVLLAAAGGLCLLYAGWTTFLVWPRTDDVPDPAGAEPVDAVVMLAGADDGRHDLARDLLEAGRAPVLVVSNPEGEDEPKAWALCHGASRPTGAEAICVDPEPRTTWGEALAVYRLAEDRGWRRIVVVTNRPHSLRARETLRRATGLDVRIHAIDRVDRWMLPVHAGWEAAGFVKARVLGRW